MDGCGENPDIHPTRLGLTNTDSAGPGASAGPTPVVRSAQAHKWAPEPASTTPERNSQARLRKRCVATGVLIPKARTAHAKKRHPLFLFLIGSLSRSETPEWNATDGCCNLQGFMNRRLH